MKEIKLLIGLVLIATLLSWKSDPKPSCKNSHYLLKHLKKKYDMSGQWNQSLVELHIQEPRLGNPLRYTKLRMNNSDDYFEMERFREDGIVKRILTGAGESKIMLNDEMNLSQQTIKDYKLNVERTLKHKQFYEMMYGLPMSITDQKIKGIQPAVEASYEQQAVYRIQLELKEKLISNYWTLIVGMEANQLLAIEFRDQANSRKGEIIKFESEFDIKGMKIPRVRNWYTLDTNEYLGSDVIVEALE